MSQMPPDTPPPPGGWGRPPGPPQQQPPIAPAGSPPYPPQPPQPPGPTGYGVAGYPPAPAPKPGMPTGIKVLIGLVALIIVAAGAVFLLSGDDDSSGSPDQTVRDFFAASTARDCPRMLGLVTEASWSQNGTVSRQEALDTCVDETGQDDFPDDASISDVRVTDQSGDTATVEVTSSLGGEGPLTETLTLRREEGKWLIDFMADDAASATPGG